MLPIGPDILWMTNIQSTGHEEGLNEGQTKDQHCTDVQHCRWNPSKYQKTIDTQERYACTVYTEAVLSEK